MIVKIIAEFVEELDPFAINTAWPSGNSCVTHTCTVLSKVTRPHLCLSDFAFFDTAS